MPRITAVITAYNREDFVARCVQSVLDEAMEQLEVRVLVMDNGSIDDTAKVADALGPNVEVHRTEENRHIVEVLNRGIAMALADLETDHVVAMNEDTMYTPGSLRALLQVAEAQPHSLITPLQMNYRQPDEIDANMLGHVKSLPGFMEDFEADALKPIYELPTIIGAALFAHREVWENIGAFDPLFWFYGIDDDYCTRAKWLGYRLLLAGDSRLYHAHGKLNEDPASPDRPALTRKWRYELQARYLFKLKNPNRGLFGAYLDAKMLMFETIFGCLGNLWPMGALHALVIYLGLALQLPQVARARRRDFDPARKIG